MSDSETLSHTKWECKYHVVFIPKYRRKALYKELRRHLGEVFRSLAEQKECRIEEGHLMLDHVHVLLSVPPKYAVAQVVGFIKGKSAIHIARTFLGRRKNYTGHHFGLGGTTSQRLAGMRGRSGNTFAPRKRRIDGWIN
jgi:putative transposase